MAICIPSPVSPAPAVVRSIQSANWGRYSRIMGSLAAKPPVASTTPREAYTS